MTGAGEPGKPGSLPMSPDNPYRRLVEAAEGWYAEHGDNYRGAGWTKSQAHADTRFRVMLDVVEEGPTEPVDLLDLGCGTSQLYEHMLANGLERRIRYSGLDLSPTLLARSRAKFPENSYYDVDLLEGPGDLPEFDYVVVNGIFTFKDGLSHDQMLELWRALTERAFAHARRGIAFNAMSKQVEWERDDLFHLPFDVMASFLAERLSRRFVIRHDYGLYEYTTYVYR